MRLFKKLLKMLTVIILLLIVGAVGGLYWASRGFDADQPASEPEVNQTLVDQINVDPSPDALVVLTYNIAYGRGSVDDIGDLRSEQEVRQVLEGLAAFLIEADADVVAIQEVDFDGHRTHHVEELEYLADEAGYPYRARITTWRNNYVPFPYWPPSQHFGAIHSGQAVLSRYPILDNRRTVMPQPDANPFYYNAFYLHRSIQRVTLEVGDDEITLYNCHLEAFNVENRSDQAQLVVEEVREDGRDRWIVLGDMNSPPPEAPQRTNFVDEPGWDATDDATISILREGLGVIENPGLELYESNQEQSFTFPTGTPTRRLDYIFTSADLPVQSSQIVYEAGLLSDHYPVIASIRLTPPTQPDRTAVPVDETEDSEGN